MILLSNYTGKKLELVQQKLFKEFYELTSEDELLGSVQVKGIFNFRALFKSSFGDWEIYNTGFWKSIFEVKHVNNELPFAKFVKDKWKSGGIIELPRGERLKIKSNIWKDSIEIQTDSGRSIVKLNKRFSFKDKTEITLEQNSEIIDKHPWVIIMAWFIMKVSRTHAARAH